MPSPHTLAVQVEVQALVRQRRIAHCRAYALELLGKEVGHGQVLHEGVAPVVAPHMLVCLLYGRFGQAVGQRLGQEVAVVVLAGAELLKAGIDRCHEQPYLVGRGSDEICQAEIGRALLAEECQAHGRTALPDIVQHNILVVRMAGTQQKTEVSMVALAVGTQETLCLLEQLHGLGRTAALGLREEI